MVMPPLSAFTSLFRLTNKPPFLCMCTRACMCVCVCVCVRACVFSLRTLGTRVDDNTAVGASVVGAIVVGTIVVGVGVVCAGVVATKTYISVQLVHELYAVGI